jgi:hypothetical protein
MEALSKQDPDAGKAYEVLEERVGRYWQQAKKINAIRALPKTAPAPEKLVE